MKKRLISIFIALSIGLSTISAFAYDPSKGALEFMQSKSEEYMSIEEIEVDEGRFKAELVQNYEYTEEEADEIFDVFLETMAGKFDDMNNQEKVPEISPDNNENKNSSDRQEPAIKTDPELLLKKKALAQLGIITDEEFEYDGRVKRELYSTYIANMISYGEDYSETDGYFKFSDVTEENEHYDAISLLINKGAVVGVGGGLFKPEDDITLNQASAIIVRVTGYDVYKMPDDENDIFYWNKANEMGLLKGISINRNDVLTGGQAVILLYNLLYSKIVSMDFNNHTIEYMNEAEFCKEYMNLSYTDGIVEANSMTSLYSQSGAVPEGRLKINGTEYAFPNINDADEYLGRYVRIFYDTEGENEARAIIEMPKWNDSLTIKAEEIDRYDVTDARYYYTLESSQKEEWENIYLDTAIIFNGVAVDYYENKALLLNPDSGEVTILDNDRDGKADVLFVTSYTYYLFGMINEHQPILYDEFGIQPQIDLENDGVKIIQNGSEANVTKIPNGSVVMVKASRVRFDPNTNYMNVDVANSAFITAEICTSSVDGVVQSKAEDMIKIDGTVYTISKWFKKAVKLYTLNDKLKKPSISSSVKTFLDKYGNAVYFMIYKSDGIKYGYVVNSYLDEENGDIYWLKIFTQDGEMMNLPLAEKINIHKKWESGELSNTTYYSQKKPGKWLIQFNGGSFKNQLIKYVCNKNNEINEIYLADNTNTATRETVGTKMNFYVSDEIFMKGFSNVGEEGIWNYTLGGFLNPPPRNEGYYFRIPKTPTSDEDYVVSQESILTSGSHGWDEIEFYDIDKGGTPKCVVQYADPLGSVGKIEGSAKNIVITKKPIAEWDAKTETIVYRVEAYAPTWIERTMQAGTFREFTFADNNLVSFPIITSGFESYSNVPISELDVGDVLFIYTSDDNDSEICGFMVSGKDIDTADSSGNLKYGFYNTVISDTSSQIIQQGANGITRDGIVRGRVERNANNKIFYIDDHSGYFRRVSLEKSLYFTDMVVIFDAKRQQIIEGTFSDIKEGDYIFVQTESLAVIVRNY